MGGWRTPLGRHERGEGAKYLRKGRLLKKTGSGVGDDGEAGTGGAAWGKGKKTG